MTQQWHGCGPAMAGSEWWGSAGAVRQHCGAGAGHLPMPSTIPVSRSLSAATNSDTEMPSESCLCLPFTKICTRSSLLRNCSCRTILPGHAPGHANGFSFGEPSDTERLPHRSHGFTGQQGCDGVAGQR